jgi:outer membrane receptor protein involved in Fe transport
MRTIKRIVAALALGMVFPAWGVDFEQQVEFSIPAQTLSSALMEFAEQASVQVLTASEDLSAYRTQGVRGKQSVRAALTSILSGTDLGFREVGEGTVTIHRNNAMIGVTARVADSEQPAKPTEVSLEQLEEITVTGTHIRSAPGTIPASPLIQITRQDIERSGAASTGELIAQLPQNYNGATPQVAFNPSFTSEFSGVSGVSTPSLRGLGDATLTLVNGHRLARTGGANGADISGIPLAAIDRVEVVADGASAVYGSDAVAGVMNFVLKRDFRGAQLDAALSQPTREGGSQQQDYSLLAGTAWGGGNALLTCAHNRISALYNRERNFSRNFLSDSTLYPGTETNSCTAFARQTLSPTISIDFDALYAHRTSESSFGPFFGALQTGDTGARQYAFGTQLQYQSGRWMWRLSGNATRNKEQATTRQNISGSITTLNVSQLQEREYSVELNGDGPIATLPSGDILVAFGAGHRNEDYELSFPFGFTSGLSGDRNVQYAFGELQAPLVRQDHERVGLNALNISFALRHDRYSDFGGTTNPKFGIVYVPSSSLQLRATYGESFRAPLLSNLYSEQDAFLFLAPLESQAPNDLVPILFTSGGNSSLRPEKSSAETVTVDYTPSQIPQLALSATLFQYRFTDKIVYPITVDPSVGLNDSRLALFTTVDPPGDVVNGIVDNAGLFLNLEPQYTLADVQAILDGRFANASTWKAHGVDVSVRYTQPLGRSSLDLSFIGTRLNIRTQAVRGAETFVLSGTAFGPPKTRFRLGATLNQGRWSASSFANYTGTETNTFFASNTQIASFTTCDFQLSYQIPRNEGGAWSGTRLSLGALNALDKDPPRLPQALSALSPSFSGYDASNASPFGRLVTVRLSKEFY